MVEQSLPDADQAEWPESHPNGAPAGRRAVAHTRSELPADKPLHTVAFEDDSCITADKATYVAAGSRRAQLLEGCDA